MNRSSSRDDVELVPVAELGKRWSNLQARMASADIDAVVVLQNADLYYFSGTLQSGLLYVPVQGNPVYLVRRDEQRARRESCLPHIVPFGSFRQVSQILSDCGLPRAEKVGMELDVLPVATYQRVHKALGEPHVVDATPLIRSLRAIKSEWELSHMRRAAIQLDQSWRRAIEVAHEGLSDLELAIELEGMARRQGHPGYARMRAFNGEIAMGTVLVGADGSVPAFRNTPLGGVGLHPSIGFGVSGRRIAKGEPVTVDLVGYCAGYLADQTRTFVIGALADPLRRAYEAMCQIQKLMVHLARPGVAWGYLYDECCRLAAELGYGRQFMGEVASRVPFIGHGIGLEIDESPFIARGLHDRVLEENMTFAFEPKAVFPGQGAVGIENTFVVTADGLDVLTISDESLCIL